LREEPVEAEGLSASDVYNMVIRMIYLVIGVVVAFIAQKGVFEMLVGQGVGRPTAATSGVIVFGVVFAFWFATLAFFIKSKEETP